MKTKTTNENLVNNSNHSQQENLNEKSLQILEMTREKKEKIQSLRIDG